MLEFGLFVITVYLFIIICQLSGITDILKDIRAHIEANEENEE